jgi:putative ABC transport system ATP-binding protein
MGRKMGYIELNEVCKHYKMGEVKITAVDGVSFTIDKGEFAVVLGASGAGKTTVLNLLGGMDSMDSGTIMIDGEDISAYSQRMLTEYRRTEIGFVFQFYNLVQNLTARENVELATQISPNPLQVESVMQLVGLQDRMDNFPSQLSGGEQQRVAIARALAKNPKLLLCDEPTGALDYQTGKSILKLLQDTCKQTGMTVVVISHNSTLADIADKVIRMRNGKISSLSVNDNPMPVESIEW